MWLIGHAKNAKPKWTRRQKLARDREHMVVQRSRRTAANEQHGWSHGWHGESNDGG